MDTHHELERLADPPPVSMDIDFLMTEVTFLPAEDLRILREADNDDESVVTFCPRHEAAEAKCAASVADDSATARVEASDEREPHAIDDLSIAFTQEHVEQAAARYRLSRQVQGAQASISQRRTRNQREAKRAELSTHDFDLPTIEQRVADSAARMAERRRPDHKLEAAATRAAGLEKRNFGLD